MITFVLEKTLHEMGLTKNRLAVEADVRPNTISDIVSGQTKRMDMQTLDSIVDALNEIAISRNMSRRFTINDIIIYERSDS